MGNARLGRLSKKYKWGEVVQALSSPEDSFNEIVKLTARASEETLVQSKYVDTLSHCFWLYTNIAEAARKEDFVQNLQDLSIEISPSEHGFKILQKIYDSASNFVNGQSRFSTLEQIACDAFKSSILLRIERESNSLFGCNVETVQKALKKLSTKNSVCELGREFFSNYMYRAFSFTLEKELANNVKSNAQFSNVQDIEEFKSRLKTYCWDISKILEDFSGEWFSKHAYQGDLKDKATTKKFTQHAIKKLLSEATREVV